VQDVVQIFEAAVDALNRVDREAMVRLVDPDIAFVPMRSGVTGPYLGHAGLDDFLADNAEKYEYFLAEFDTLEVLPDGRLLSIGRIRVRGLGGEAETVVKTAGIASFRNGRMLSWHDYGDERIARAKANET
jgi:limonene-1,2-epoxide hydrolase